MPTYALANAPAVLPVDLIVVGIYPKAAGGRWWSGPDRQSLAERVNCAVFIAVDDTKR